MARSHARIQVAIWRNQGWLALTPKAKLTYLTVLSQPRLSLVGTIDLAVGRWAVQTGMERTTVQDALDELTRERFVVYDEATDELLIRTFVTHDLDPNRVNVNLAKGLWGQWGCIASTLLRSVALHEMPQDVWERLEPHAPPDAVQTRRSPRLEPVSASRSQLPPSSLLPPVSYHPPADPPPVDFDLDHHPIPVLPAEQIEANRHGIAALKHDLHPELHAIPQPGA